MKKKLIVYMLSGMLAVTSLMGCSSFDGSETALTVNDTEVTADMANFYARYMQAQYETYYSAYIGEDMWNTEAGEGETYEEAVKSSVQETLETLILLEQHMDEYEVSLSDAEKEAVEEVVYDFDENNALHEKELVSGDKETVERIVTLMAIQQKMQDAIEAGADTEVSDEEAAQKGMSYLFFPFTVTDAQGNQTEITDEEKEVLKKQAESAAKKAKKGEKLPEIAKDVDLEVQRITFDADTTTIDAEVIKAADALKKNGVTDAIETDSGYYVAKVTTLFDKDATEKEKKNIISERKTQLYQDTCDKWIEEADIKVNDSVWKKIDFNELAVTLRVQEDVPYTDEVKTDDQVDLEEEEDAGEATTGETAE